MCQLVLVLPHLTQLAFRMFQESEYPAGEYLQFEKRWPQYLLMWLQGPLRYALSPAQKVISMHNSIWMAWQTLFLVISHHKLIKTQPFVTSYHLSSFSHLDICDDLSLQLPSPLSSSMREEERGGERRREEEGEGGKEKRGGNEGRREGAC